MATSEQVEPEQHYRIAWRSKLTGFTGHGEPLSKEVADTWLKKAAAEYPDIEHWVKETKADANK